jgi:hypothetical protein
MRRILTRRRNGEFTRLLLQVEYYLIINNAGLWFPSTLEGRKEHAVRASYFTLTSYFTYFTLIVPRQRFEPQTHVMRSASQSKL